MLYFAQYFFLWSYCWLYDAESELRFKGCLILQFRIGHQIQYVKAVLHNDFDLPMDMVRSVFVVWWTSSQ